MALFDMLQERSAKGDFSSSLNVNFDAEDQLRVVSNVPYGMHIYILLFINVRPVQYMFVMFMLFNVYHHTPLINHQGCFGSISRSCCVVVTLAWFILSIW